MCCSVWRNVYVISCWVQHLLNYQFSQQYSYISLWQVGRLWGSKDLKGQLQYLHHHHHHLGLDILWQNGRLHHICGRSCHLKQDQNDKNEWYTSPCFLPLLFSVTRTSLLHEKKGSLHIHCWVNWGQDNLGIKVLNTPMTSYTISSAVGDTSRRPTCSVGVNVCWTISYYTVLTLKVQCVHVYVYCYMYGTVNDLNPGVSVVCLVWSSRWE